MSTCSATLTLPNDPIPSVFLCDSLGGISAGAPFFERRRRRTRRPERERERERDIFQLEKKTTRQKEEGGQTFVRANFERRKKKEFFNAPPRRFRDRPLFFHPRGGCLPSSSSSSSVLSPVFSASVFFFFFFFFFFFCWCPLRFFSDAEQKKIFPLLPPPV